MPGAWAPSTRGVDASCLEAADDGLDRQNEPGGTGHVVDEGQTGPSG